MAPRTSILLAALALFTSLIHPSLSAPVNTTTTPVKFFKPTAVLHWPPINETLHDKSASDKSTTSPRPNCAQFNTLEWNDALGYDPKKHAETISSTTTNLEKRQSFYYVCSNGVFPAPGWGPPGAGAVSYSQQAALYAASIGDVYRLQYAVAGRAGRYPHQFGNYENLPGIGRACGFGNPTLWEFPIMPDGSIYEGGAVGPGLDRVIWDACAQDVCGVITHRGRNGNLFQDCEREATI